MIVLGRIVAPFGVNGWVKVHPFGDDPLNWRRMPVWWLGRDDGSQAENDWQSLKLRGCRAHGKGLVAAFEGVEDRSAAEALDGLYIAAPREALPQPEKDEYYWADLIGLRVENLRGEELGTVHGLMDNGAHSVLEVQDSSDGVTQEKRILIPFVGAYVQQVDIAARCIRVEWERDW